MELILTKPAKSEWFRKILKTSNLSDFSFTQDPNTDDHRVVGHALFQSILRDLGYSFKQTSHYVDVIDEQGGIAGRFRASRFAVTLP